MAQRQIPGGTFVNETGTAQRQVPGGAFINETVAATGGATLTPNLYTNAQTFYSPTISAGAVTLTPALYTNPNTFYSAIVEQGGATQDLTPSLYTNINSFYNATVSTSNTLTPSLYSNENSFFSPTISTTVGLTPSLYTNNNTFYTHLIEVEGGAQNVLPNLYTNTNTFYSATVSVGSVTLTPALYTNTNSFFAASITTSNTLVAPFVVNTSSFFTHEITQGAGAVQNLQPNLFTNNNVFFVHLLSGGESVTLGAGSSKRKKKTKQYLVDGVLRELTDEQVAQLMYDAAQQPKKIVLEDKPEPLDVPEELKKKSIFRSENLEKPKAKVKTPKPVFAKEVLKPTPEHIVVEQVKAIEVDPSEEEYIMKLLAEDEMERKALARSLQWLHTLLSGRR